VFFGSVILTVRIDLRLNCLFSNGTSLHFYIPSYLFMLSKVFSAYRLFSRLVKSRLWLVTLECVS